jgi:hypothetical protein
MWIGCGSTESDFLSVVWYNMVVLFLSIAPTLIGMPAIMVRCVLQLQVYRTSLVGCRMP